MNLPLITGEQFQALARPKKRHKFGAVKAVQSGVTYDSKGEAAYAAELELKKKAGIIRDWIRQVRMPMIVNGVKVCELRFDFRVFYADGTSRIHEFKGVRTPIFNLKMRLFKALHPNEIVEIVTKKR